MMSEVNQKSSPTRLIDPSILSRISNLDLLARGVVEGFVGGLHKSPYKGFSVEFLEYRPYSPGDDPMRIDWKLFMRSDRLYIKQFEDETNTNCSILLDTSKSMDYSSTHISKLQYSIYLAASLAYFMIRQRDSAGLCLFDHKIKENIPAKSGKGHLHTLLNILNTVQPDASTNMSKPFHELADNLKKRGIVIIISDLLDSLDHILAGLKHFRFNGNNVIVFHIMDPLELSFEYDGILELEDMETGEKMVLAADQAKETYQHNLDEFKSSLTVNCGLLNIDYTVLTTDQPLDHALFKYLSKRSSIK
ncbi:DUF58 domain-containing protein [candidate division KSB1 bacterium]|nr:DUF58 domain-containing protein [candidate division KSB1 bacterium]